MPPVTTVFEPENSGNMTIAIVCFLMAIAAIVGLVFYNKKKIAALPSDSDTPYRPNRFKPLASLGLFFIFLICISTAFFSWLSTLKISTVTINEEYIETYYGKVEWNRIDRIYVHEDQQVAPFSGKKVGEVTRILTIIEIGGKTHALSEINFDINEMGKTIHTFRKK